MLVGRARGKYGIDAPAVSGNEIFERFYRVQQNTGEQLMVFLPAITIYGYYGNPLYASIAGVIFLIGRALYCQAYVNDPAKRAPGFIIGFLANMYLLFAGLIAVVRNIL